MRLFADEQHRHRPIAPQAEVEGEAAEQADDRVDDLDRQAGELQNGQRLAVRLEAEQIGEDLAHRIAADIRVLEHERVARVIAQPVDAGEQVMVAHARGTVLELAHALVDQRDEVLHRVGNRRVDGESGIARIGAAQGGPLRDSALRLVEALGNRDLLGEDFNLILDAGTPVIERVDEFLEVEQPERQLQRRGVNDVGARTEALAGHG